MFIHDLFELRYIIEPAAAFLAAARRSDDQVSGMRDAQETMRLFGLGSDQGQLADKQFHELLLVATGNSTLGTMASSISTAVRWTTYFKQVQTRNPRVAWAEPG